MQTVMSLEKPWRPILPHLSALLLCFYYCHRPKTTTELGLGGGSLQRFFRYHFPNCAFQSVEFSEDVIQLFQDWFQAGFTDYQISHLDAQLALRNLRAQDLLFIDLFSGHGSPDFVFSERFYQNCLQTLSHKGLLVINLVTASYLQSELLLDILRSLKLHFRSLSVPGYQNKIIFAATHSLPAIQYDNGLQELARQYELNLDAVVAMN